MSRQKKYEEKQRAKGLERVPFWIPADREAEIRLLIEKLVDNPDLTISTARSISTGKMVSIEK